MDGTGTKSKPLWTYDRMWKVWGLGAGEVAGPFQFTLFFCIALDRTQGLVNVWQALCH